MVASSSATDDTQTSSSSDDDYDLPQVPLHPEPGRVMCWCKLCVGLVRQHTWKALEHVETFGRHESQFPGASSSRQVLL